MSGQQTYENAYQELKQIMEDLSGEKISVDELTVKVKRASELITFCSAMLKSTESQVNEIVKKIGI